MFGLFKKQKPEVSPEHQRILEGLTKCAETVRPWFSLSTATLEQMNDPSADVREVDLLKIVVGPYSYELGGEEYFCAVALTAFESFGGMDEQAKDNVADCMREVFARTHRVKDKYRRSKSEIRRRFDQTLAGVERALSGLQSPPDPAASPRDLLPGYGRTFWSFVLPLGAITGARIAKFAETGNSDLLGMTEAETEVCEKLFHIGIRLDKQTLAPLDVYMDRLVDRITFYLSCLGQTLGQRPPPVFRGTYYVTEDGRMGDVVETPPGTPSLEEYLGPIRTELAQAMEAGTPTTFPVTDKRAQIYATAVIVLIASRLGFSHYNTLFLLDEVIRRLGVSSHLSDEERAALPEADRGAEGDRASVWHKQFMHFTNAVAEAIQRGTVALDDDTPDQKLVAACRDAAASLLEDIRNDAIGYHLPSNTRITDFVELFG